MVSLSPNAVHKSVFAVLLPIFHQYSWTFFLQAASSVSFGCAGKPVEHAFLMFAEHALKLPSISLNFFAPEFVVLLPHFGADKLPPAAS